MTHTFSGETIDFNLVYKKRKTLGIYIDLYGNVEVRVPKETSEESVLSLLEKKWDWIQEQTEDRKMRMGGVREKSYDNGEKFLYLGRSYPIVISQDIELEQDRVECKEDKLVVFVRQYEEERIKQALKHFYYQQCKALVEARIRFYQSKFTLKPRGIRILNNDTNWGTCNSKRELTFHWRLAMAPIESIDYVVVHEMCHMIHLNHDRSFWRLVGKMLPDYEQRQHWLALSNWKMTL